MEEANGVLVLLNDLMFQVKIAEAAKPFGMETKFVKSAAKLIEWAEQEEPALILLDLSYAEADPLGAIRTLKAGAETQAIPMLGYVPHVQTALRAAAVEAGCDVVMARSAFIQNLREILGRYAVAVSSTTEG